MNETDDEDKGPTAIELYPQACRAVIPKSYDPVKAAVFRSDLISLALVLSCKIWPLTASHIGLAVSCMRLAELHAFVETCRPFGIDELMTRKATATCIAEKLGWRRHDCDGVPELLKELGVTFTGQCIDSVISNLECNDSVQKAQELALKLLDMGCRVTDSSDVEFMFKRRMYRLLQRAMEKGMIDPAKVIDRYWFEDVRSHLPKYLLRVMAPALVAKELEVS